MITSPKSPLLITAIQMALLLFAIYVVFIGGQTAQGVYDHTWRLITLYLYTATIGAWLLWRLLGRRKIPATPLDGPLLLLVVAWLVSTLLSVNPVYSQETLVFFAFYLFFFYIAVDLGRRPWFVELALNAIIGVTGLVLTFALLQLVWWLQDQLQTPALLTQYGGDVWLPPRLSVLGNPNTMASFLALVTPLLLYKLISSHRAVTRGLLGLWLLASIGAILLTQSRGGLVAFVVAVALFTAGWLVSDVRISQRFKTPESLYRKKWIFILTAVGAVTLVLVGIGWVMLSVRGVSPGLIIRQQVMTGALKTWAQHPLLGSGPGTLGQKLIQNQKPLDQIWADAHNLYLTLAAETGLLGAVGLVWLALVMVKQTWLMLKALRIGRWPLSSLAGAAALWGFAAHNLVDSLLKFPLIMLLVVSLAGFWLAPLTTTAKSKAKSWGYPALGVAMAGLAVIFVLGWYHIGHIARYNQAVEAAGRGDWQTSLAELQGVLKDVPDMPFYQRQAGFAAGVLAQQKPAYLATAIQYYRQALAHVHQLAIDHANLACLLWQDGQSRIAVQEMQLARQLDPWQPVYALNLGYYLEQMGDTQSAVTEYTYTLAYRPDGWRSNFWQQSEARRAALPQIIEQTKTMLHNAAQPSLVNKVQFHLVYDDPDAAQQVIEANRRSQTPASPATIAMETGRILWLDGQLDQARSFFETALQHAPRTAEAYLYLSRIALTQEQLEAAAHYVNAAFFLGPTPEILMQAGRVAIAQKRQQTALRYFEQAFQEAIPSAPSGLSRYATEVARRRPLPQSQLPCLLQLYPSQQLIEITAAEGEIYEQQENYAAAIRTYRRLLDYEPSSQSIASKLATLCQHYPKHCAD